MRKPYQRLVGTVDPSYQDNGAVRAAAYHAQVSAVGPDGVSLTQASGFFGLQNCSTMYLFGPGSPLQTQFLPQ